MVDALVGVVIAVIATSALALVIEVGEQAIQREGEPLSSYEQDVVKASMVAKTDLNNQYDLVRSWMDEKRK